MNNNEYIAFSCYEKVSRSLSYERHKGNIEKEIIHNDFVFPESKVSILIALKDYYLEGNPFLENQRTEVLNINICRFIDEKIQVLKNSVNEDEKEFEKLQVITQPAILEILFHEMPDRFISKLDKEIFYLHFLTNNPNLPSINQIGERFDFIYLMDNLTKYFNRRVISSSKKGKDVCDKWLSEHFTFEGVTLNAKGISTARSKKQGELPKSILTINKILQEIGKIATNNHL
jgi:hypothetical protein